MANYCFISLFKAPVLNKNPKNQLIPFTLALHYRHFAIIADARAIQ